MSWPPERFQALKPANMSPEFRFTISKAVLMPTKHDAASAIDFANIRIILFWNFIEEIVGDADVVCMAEVVLQ
jgi:hypothetical protein